MSATGTVLRVGSITNQFQRESPLHPAARAFIADAFDRGWADPSKIHGESRQAAILLNEAKEIFAAHLGIRSNQVDFLSDPALGFHLGSSSVLQEGSRFYFSAVDRSEIYALANLHHGEKLSVALDGSIAYPKGRPTDLLSWQTLNGETGIISAQPSEFTGRLFVDASASGAAIALPQNWSTALWNSQAWEGPTGLGVFAVADRSIWRNPLPHIDQRISSSELSIPLVMASAIALEAHTRDYAENRASLLLYNNRIRQFLAAEIGDVDIAGSSNTTVPYLLSFSLLYIDAERLVNELTRQGISVDSGSACSSANMEPSHVLAAMGLLTHGNVRMTLHNQTTLVDVEAFLKTLKIIVEDLRK